VKLRIALLGTRGIPARYGGFETFAEELSTRLVERGHEVTVYCRDAHRNRTTAASAWFTFHPSATNTPRPRAHLRVHPPSVAPPRST
jgi:hypothetical protein